MIYLLAQVERDYLDVTIISAVVVALFGALMAVMKKMNDDAAKREEKMGKVIEHHAEFQRGHLVSIIEGNVQAMNAHSTALQQNTRATKELEREIREFRKEAEHARHKTGDSGIHPGGPKLK